MFDTSILLSIGILALIGLMFMYFQSRIGKMENKLSQMSVAISNTLDSIPVQTQGGHRLSVPDDNDSDEEDETDSESSERESEGETDDELDDEGNVNILLRGFTDNPYEHRLEYDVDEDNVDEDNVDDDSVEDVKNITVPSDEEIHNYKKYSIVQLKQILTDKGIEFNSKMKKNDMIDLLLNNGRKEEGDGDNEDEGETN